MKKMFPLMLTLALSACGFHLRGMVEIPTWLKHIAIVSQVEDKELDALFTAQLESYNVEVEPDPSVAPYWLVISKDNLHKQIISVGASTNPRQYILTLNIEFSLQTQKGQMIKTPKNIQVTRQLTINNDRILGSSEEESILAAEMKQDAIIQIINQLSHIDGVIQLKPGTRT